MIDLNALPDPEVIKSIDYDEWLANFVARYKTQATAAGVTWDADLSSDPVMIQLETSSWLAVLFVSFANEAARNQILAYSTGADLDHLAAFYGVARLVGEDDVRLRKRIQLATIGGSVGGTEARFKSIAMAADLRVRDVKSWKEKRDPTVRIAVLSTDIGGNADAELLAVVQAALEVPDALLVSDRLEVMSAVRQTVDVELTVTLEPDAPATLLSEMSSYLIDARDSLDPLLDLDLTRAWLTKTAMRTGVSNVEIHAPAADVVAEKYEAIAIGTVTVIDGGRDR